MVIQVANLVSIREITTEHIICLWEVGGIGHFCNRTLIVISYRFSYNARCENAHIWTSRMLTLRLLEI